MATLAIAALPAQASTGVKLLHPNAGQVFPVATPITFSALVRGPGTRYLHICKSKKVDRNGKLCFSETVEPMKRGKRHGKYRVWSATPKLLPSLPSYYQNAPGTYYWQVHRIACNRKNDCVQESKVRSFVIR
jgi:hypothetical protein